MMRIEIKSRFDALVLFAHEAEGNTMRITVEAAVNARVNLRGAYLGGAYLRGADLGRADLRGADLGGKKLVGDRPVLQIGPVGSRDDYLLAFLTDSGIKLTAGCWHGSRDEFAVAVAETHGDNVHAQEYRAALAVIDAHAALWTPAIESEKASA